MGTAQLPPVPDFEAIEHKAQANVERQTAILTLIGNLVLSWSNNESMFIYVLMVLLEVDEVTAAVVFTTLNTTRARIDLVQRLAAIKLADRAAAQKLEKIVKRFNDLTRIRNEFNHSMYALNEAGEITGYMGLHLDVTERKRFQEELARKEAQFRFIFESSPVGISWRSQSPDGTVVRLVNDAHVRICGLSREEAEQPGAFAAISDPEVMAAQDRSTARLEAGEISEFSMEKRYKRRDGVTVWVMLTRQRKGYPDGSFEDLTTIVDITDL